MVYLDYNATTPVDRQVLEKMLPYFCEKWGNASSRDHALGWDAADAAENARDAVADLINASPDEIVFTSGASESINLALRALSNASKKRVAVTCATEHEAVLGTCRAIELNSNTRVHYLPADCVAGITPDLDTGLMRGVEIAFVSVMMANNEVGTILPIIRWLRPRTPIRSLLFSDITQAVGKVPVDVRNLGIDVAAFSAHKLYGPKGVGALFYAAQSHRRP